MKRTNSFDKAKVIISRWLAAVTAKDQDVITRAVTLRVLRMAEELRYLSEAAEVDLYRKKENPVVMLAPKGMRGQRMTSGRLAKALPELLGAAEVPVLIQRPCLAYLRPR